MNSKKIVDSLLAEDIKSESQKEHIDDFVAGWLHDNEDFFFDGWGGDSWGWIDKVGGAIIVNFENGDQESFKMSDMGISDLSTLRLTGKPKGKYPGSA